MNWDKIYISLKDPSSVINGFPYNAKDFEDTFYDDESNSWMKQNIWISRRKSEDEDEPYLYRIRQVIKSESESNCTMLHLKDHIFDDDTFQQFCDPLKLETKFSFLFRRYYLKPKGFCVDMVRINDNQYCVSASLPSSEASVLDDLSSGPTRTKALHYLYYNHKDIYQELKSSNIVLDSCDSNLTSQHLLHKFEILASSGVTVAF